MGKVMEHYYLDINDAYDIIKPLNNGYDNGFHGFEGRPTNNDLNFLSQLDYYYKDQSGSKGDIDNEM